MSNEVGRYVHFDLITFAEMLEKMGSFQVTSG